MCTKTCHNATPVWASHGPTVFEINRLLQDGTIFKESSTLKESNIYIDNVKWHQERQDPALPKINSLFWCDTPINLLAANICITITYRSIITQNLNGLDFDLSRPLRVKYIMVELDSRSYMIAYFGLIVPQWLIRLLFKLQLREIWITLILTFRGHSLKNVITVGFLLASNSKHISISHCLAVMCTWKVSYHLSKISDKRRSNRITSSRVRREGYHQK